jgi:hypothetical protein
MNSVKADRVERPAPRFLLELCDDSIDVFLPLFAGLQLRTQVGWSRDVIGTRHQSARCDMRTSFQPPLSWAEWLQGAVGRRLTIWHILSACGAALAASSWLSLTSWKASDQQDTWPRLAPSCRTCTTVCRSQPCGMLVPVTATYRNKALTMLMMMTGRMCCCSLLFKSAAMLPVAVVALVWHSVQCTPYRRPLAPSRVPRRSPPHRTPVCHPASARGRA